jgi:hypothetical protein
VKKYAAWGLAPLALAAQAQMASYDTAWGAAAVNRIHTERSDNLAVNGLVVSATHHFTPVKMGLGQAFGEQAWLQKASHIYVSHNPASINQNDVVNARQDQGKFGTKIYSGPVVSEVEFESQVSSSTFYTFAPMRLVGQNTEAQRVSLGYFVGPSATVSLVRASSKTTTNTNFSYTGSYYEALTSTSVAFHGVVPLSSSSTLVLDGAISKSDYSTTFNQTNFQQELGFKYYPLNTLYVGLNYKRDMGEDKTSERRITSVSSGMMVHPRWNIHMGLVKSVGDGYNYNNYQINTVGAEYRM